MKMLLGCYVKINRMNNNVLEKIEYSKNIPGFDFKLAEIWNKKNEDSRVCYEKITR